MLCTIQANDKRISAPPLGPGMPDRMRRTVISGACTVMLNAGPRRN